MIRRLTDEDCRGDILHAFVRRVPEADVERVQDAGLEGRPDPEVLRWAADHGRVILSHERRTMPDHTYDRVARGEPMLGVILRL